MMIQAVRENVGLEYHRIAMEGELHLTKSRDGDIQLDLSFKLEEAHLMYERTTYSTKLALPGMYEKLKAVKFPEFPTQAEAPEWKKKERKPIWHAWWHRHAKPFNLADTGARRKRQSVY